ncbi:MAG: hypothetical protein RR952_06895 [Cetobacterium sp.]
MFDFESKNIIDNINFFSISTWVEVEFLPEDSAYIVGKIGGWSFYKDYDQNGLDKLEFLEFLEKSFQGKKDQHIHDQVLEKLKTIAPKEFCCNAEIYATDGMYRAWFARRDDFFRNYQAAKLRAERNAGRDEVYLKWMPLIDSRTPQSCYEFQDKIFNIDQNFEKIANQHWATVQKGCRCFLSSVSGRSLSRMKK